MCAADACCIITVMMTLQQFFQEHPRTAVAFSGGTDSAYLLCMARQYAGEAAAIYVNTAFQPAFELEDARHLCGLLEIPLTVTEYDILSREQVVANDADRCYYCKAALFTQIRKTAEEMGFFDIADGTNASDDAGDRPGMRALAECGILSPLRLCGITKEQIREESRHLGLFTANKPAYACLATRIPTGTRITGETLARVEQAESALAAMGFSDFRVRVREYGARVEIKKEQLALLLKNETAIRALLSPLFGTIEFNAETRG